MKQTNRSASARHSSLRGGGTALSISLPFHSGAAKDHFQPQPLPRAAQYFWPYLELIYRHSGCNTSMLRNPPQIPRVTTDVPSHQTKIFLAQAGPGWFCQRTGPAHSHPNEPPCRVSHRHTHHTHWKTNFTEFKSLTRRLQQDVLCLGEFTSNR